MIDKELALLHEKLNLDSQCLSKSLAWWHTPVNQILEQHRQTEGYLGLPTSPSSLIGDLSEIRWNIMKNAPIVSLWFHMHLHSHTVTHTTVATKTSARVLIGPEKLYFQQIISTDTLKDHYLRCCIASIKEENIDTWINDMFSYRFIGSQNKRR